jgi:hypothetical protein
VSSTFPLAFGLLAAGAPNDAARGPSVHGISRSRFARFRLSTEIARRRGGGMRQAP